MGSSVCSSCPEDRDRVERRSRAAVHRDGTCGQRELSSIFLDWRCGLQTHTLEAREVEQDAARDDATLQVLDPESAAPFRVKPVGLPARRDPILPAGRKPRNTNNTAMSRDGSRTACPILEVPVHARTKPTAKRCCGKSQRRRSSTSCPVWRHVRVHRDLTYRSTSGARLLMDVYYPSCVAQPASADHASSHGVPGSDGPRPRLRSPSRRGRG